MKTILDPENTNKTPYHSLLERMTRILCDCLFILPVVLVPIVFTSFNTNTIVMKETILQVCVCLLMLALPLAIRTNSKSANRSIFAGWPRTASLLLVILIGYLYISSTWISTHPRSEHEFFRWLSYLLLALLSIVYAADRKRYFLYLLSTVMTASAISLYAIGQSFEIDFFYQDWDRFSFGLEGVRRVCGSLGNPDYLAGHLIAIIPLSAILTLFYTKIRRGACIIITLLAVTALLFTYSRGAEAALFVTGCILFASIIILSRKNPQLIRLDLSRRNWATVFAVLIVLCGFFGMIMWDDISVTLQRIGQLGEDASTLTRPMYWRGALSMWEAKPLTGFGIGTFALYFPEYRPQQLANYQSFKEFYVEHAHNEFVEILAETGIIGFLLYGFFFLLLTGKVWKLLLQKNDRENLILLGLWLGILSALIHNLFTVTLRFTPSAFLLWSFSGVILARTTTVKKASLLPVLKKKWILYLILLAAIPSLFIFALQNYMGDYQIRQAKGWISELSPEKTQQFNHELLEDIFPALYKGADLAPDHVESHFLLGLAYYKMYDYPQSIESFEKLELHQKDFTSNRLNLAISYMKLSDLLGGNSSLTQISRQTYPLLARECMEKAIEWLERGIASDPTGPDYHHFLGRTYYYLGDLSKAESELREALRYSEQRPFEFIDSVNPSPDIHAFLGRIYFRQQKFDESAGEFHQAVQEIQRSTDRDANSAYTRDLLAEINRYLYEIQKAKKTMPAP
ncbi:MAG: O-antigen ligase family protein [Candidatus Omnitrophica bacterium]|nr:O-antigen ligase family protein [Candidatus Omnitrophota bacterium]